MMEPEALKEEGLQLFQQGRYDQALAKFETAVSLYTSTHNKTGQAEMFNNIGVIYRFQRKYDEAIQVLTQAQTLFTQLGDTNRQAQALGNLADLYQATRNRTEAARCYSDAAALFAQTGDRLRQSQVLRALSLMRLRQGQWVEAMMRMEESLKIRPSWNPAQWVFRWMLRFALRLMTGT